jgi:hypothetical protein
MGLGDGKPEGNEKAKGAVAFRLPIPQSLDALGRSTSEHPRASTVGVLMSIGASARQEG